MQLARVLPELYSTQSYYHITNFWRSPRVAYYPSLARARILLAHVFLADSLHTRKEASHQASNSAPFNGRAFEVAELAEWTESSIYQI